MSYITAAEIVAALPADYRVAALDDNADGTADDGVLEAVIDTATAEVDAYLESAGLLPLAGDVPAKARQAALWFAVELLFLRRNLTHERIFAMADNYRKLLQQVADGKTALTATVSDGSGSIAVVSEPAALDTTSPRYAL